MFFVERFFGPDLHLVEAMAASNSILGLFLAVPSEAVNSSRASGRSASFRRSATWRLSGRAAASAVADDVAEAGASRVGRLALRLGVDGLFGGSGVRILAWHMSLLDVVVVVETIP